MKVDEKGKTEQNNIVVGVLNEYEPKNRKIFTNQQVAVSSTLTDDNTNTKTTSDTSTAGIDKVSNLAPSNLKISSFKQFQNFEYSFEHTRHYFTIVDAQQQCCGGDI